ncbi:interleukin-1 receptor-like 2 [Ictalurus furcatus]|uniref:interleukin-1 receptor-like 2 n=1 Tax=Ictalurus furcatus TaxID=66913 RepID=UPI0023505AA0|nr:interleukin-1 receptor-like 2 [Ictalurus furcatus]
MTLHFTGKGVESQIKIHLQTESFHNASGEVSVSFVRKMIRCCGFLLILAFSLRSEGCMDIEQLEISEGHVFILKCPTSYEDEVVIVNWTRELNQDWDAGIKIIDQSLWFFPVKESHSGNYSCYYSDKDVPCEAHFSISVSKSKCPQPTSEVILMKNTNARLPCDSEDMRTIDKLNSVSHVGWTWMKDCSPLSWAEKTVKLRFSRVSEDDKGVYTCLMNFTYNGTSYTVAQSKKVFIHTSPVPQKPKVIKPRQETLVVKLGSKQVLNCKVFVGPGSCEMDAVESTRPYWMMNNMFTEDYPQHFVAHNGCTTENNVEYRHINLTILEVQQEFLNIPFQCCVLNSVGHDNGTVILIQSSQKWLYWTLAVFTAYAIVALGFLLFYWFKVDLILAYRTLSPCLKQQNDGKLYDAYVSYLHGDDHRVSSATTFALHVLPEVLEDRLGYKLFISGRDALPGAAVHDVISETVGKSRRLIIVLPSQAFTRPSDNEGGLLNKMPPEHLSLNNNITATDADLSESSQLNWGPYECWVGLYDALVKECLQVILVQVGGEVDDALFPESLRYVRHTQGILKWKEHYTSEPNGRFWKQMRYRMPPVQKTRTAVMV